MATIHWVRRWTSVSTATRLRPRTFKGPNNPSAPQSGVYFFAKPAAGWSNATEDTKVISPGAVDDWFGWSTSLSGNGAVAVVGAPGTEINASLFQGAAYVFTGAAATPRASVSPASLTFASQPIGTTSAPKTVTVTNAGSAPLLITNVGVTGQFTADSELQVRVADRAGKQLLRERDVQAVLGWRRQRNADVHGQQRGHCRRRADCSAPGQWRSGQYDDDDRVTLPESRVREYFHARRGQRVGG